MCVPCEAAAKERLFAATRLREAVEEKYGIGSALRTIFSPQPLTEELRALLAKLDN